MLLEGGGREEERRECDKGKETWSNGDSHIISHLHHIFNDTEWHVHSYKDSSLALTAIFVPEEDQSILIKTLGKVILTRFEVGIR